MAGVLFVALAVTTGLGTKEYQVAAQNDVWRTVSARIGVLLIVVGITLQTIGYFVIRKIIQIQV